ncbi:MAG TPA: hypothetical protein VFU22_23790 [Roseiflexaceae bacterium]|nr:hypothetical protein [Roseiflexaceae bacterium]
MINMIQHSRFSESRRKAIMTAILDAIRRQPSDMLAFEAVRVSLNVRGQIALGPQIVPVKNIIGSEGRYSDFDRRFLPRTEALEERWRSVERAMNRAIDLPPVDLWKISDVYFVRDGNHRVSVARWRGQSHIDAYVTELLVDVPLTPNLSVHTLLFAEEYSDFLEWTNLHNLRPDERIEFSELGGYLDVVRHINAYRYARGNELGRTLDRDEAVAGWYDTVYMPIVRVIREQNALKRFSGRTEADLYRWIMSHREQIGASADQQSAETTSADISALGQTSRSDSILSALRGALQHLGDRMA